MSIDITVEWNDDALASYLRDAPEAVLSEVRETLRREAEYVVTAAIPLTPVRTGLLRNSIMADQPEDTPDGPQVKVVAGKGVSYARDVHDGPERNYTEGGREFLKRAVDAQRDQVHEAVRDAMKRGLQDG